MAIGAELLRPGIYAKSGGPDGASAYDCYLASRPYRDDVSFRSVYLHFPDALVEAAGGAVDSLVYRLKTPLPSSGATGASDSIAVRFAHCIIPQAPGARDLTEEQLLQPGSADAAQALLADMTPEQASSSPATAKQCKLELVWEICIGTIECYYEYTTSCPDSGGGSSGDTGGDSGGSGGAWDGGDDTGGGSGHYDDGSGGSDECANQQLPTPGSDCAPPEPVDDPVAKAEVEELILEECSNSSLGDLGAYFQSSVRKSINKRAVPPYQQDAAGGESSNHPQLTNAVDGYAEGLRYASTSQFVPGYVTSIMEVKFTENPSNNLYGNQYRQQFADLARVYSRKPDNTELHGKPSYILITNSTRRSIQDLGSSYRYSDMVQEAKKHNINVFHFRVVKENGRYYLEGAALNDSFTTGVVNWLRDVTDINQVPLRISCAPES
jgi:hypothetical protein